MSAPAERLTKHREPPIADYVGQILDRLGGRGSGVGHPAVLIN